MPKHWPTLLHQSIPLTRLMGVDATAQADGRITIAVPLAPNVNDKGTGFGGSLAVVATLAGWVEVQRQLDLAGLGDSVEIVIQRGETTYLLPVTADFSATADELDTDVLGRFLRLFARKGLARLALTASVHCEGVLTARFEAEYVAKRAEVAV
ncbi:YiiD C-terminal domain-containing protein [Chitinimonas sp. BJYL2]|uniref:YiiD C-terminal domain-containing protein n=1 Tax=Chitinimonas sp. BJYL2 TaxID=2976696 RepID=UPI0022B31771|nr:YiiD C-terminal domain-containing protein [Chitinimonas sp. BJYL2]